LSRCFYPVLFIRRFAVGRGIRPRAVKRYVNTFGRVVSLYERGIKEADEIARYVGISAWLVLEYLELYATVKRKRGCAARIKELLEQLSSRASYPGVDASGMKKRGVAEVGK